MKKGFTLAEVLITLGIIGIVAALTIPTLVSTHKKRVVTTSLKKFVNTLLNTNEQINYDNGVIGTDGYNLRDNFEPNNPYDAENMIEKYYKPYLQITEIKKGTSGVFVFLNDGSAFYFRRLRRDRNTTNNWSGTYIWFYPKAKDCMDFYEDAENIMKVLGKKVFVIYPDGNISWAINNYNRDSRLERCKNPIVISDEGCTALIIGDGFEIKNDYPIRL